MIEPLEFNYRENRARSITAAIVARLRDCIPRTAYREAHDELMALFVEMDAEIVTTEDRKAAGLPARNDRGLTPLEHRAIEARRMEVLTSPPAPVIIGVCGKCGGPNP